MHVKILQVILGVDIWLYHQIVVHRMKKVLKRDILHFCVKCSDSFQVVSFDIISLHFNCYFKFLFCCFSFAYNSVSYNNLYKAFFKVRGVCVLTSLQDERYE